ncbi:SCP-like protein [Aphelenchoides besseyi]|nr:SCP-like protein [Aphelenchoides besseyi]KAI6212091.1 SCP-like protein [Aphelenchoides besseyi]
MTLSSLMTRKFVLCFFVLISDDSLRFFFLTRHNEYRSRLALGNLPNKNGTKLPSASNIYELGYSLDVEKIAQKHADNCILKHAEIHGTTNNLFAQSPYQAFDKIAYSAFEGWSSDELEKYGVADLNFTIELYESGIGHWSEVVWWNVREIGCGIANCPNGLGTPKTEGKQCTYVVCAYNPGGNFINDLIYVPGRPCERCNEYSNSKCNATSGLCYIENPTSTFSTSPPISTTKQSTTTSQSSITTSTILSTLSTLLTTISSTFTSTSSRSSTVTSSATTRRPTRLTTTTVVPSSSEIVRTTELLESTTSDAT